MNHEQFALLSCRLCTKYRVNKTVNSTFANLCSHYLNWIRFVKRAFNEDDINFFTSHMEALKLPVPLAPDCFVKKRVKRVVQL